MRAPIAVLTLILAGSCSSQNEEPEQVSECRAIKAAGYECVEHQPLEEALATYASESAQAKLRQRYARGEKLCKTRARENWSREEKNKLAMCYRVLADYDRSATREE